MTARLVPVVLALPLIALAAFFGGRALKGNAAGAIPFDLAAPAYSAAPLASGQTKAGFTGFGAGGPFEGETLLAGRVSEVTPDALIISTEAGQSRVRVTSEERLRLIAAGSVADIIPGASVVVRLKANTVEAEGVLVVLAP